MGGVIAPSASVTGTSVPWQILLPVDLHSSRAGSHPLQTADRNVSSFPPFSLHLLDWSQYTAAPGAITDMLRPSVKPLSATYQHTNSPL